MCLASASFRENDFLLGILTTADLLLAIVMDRVFVPDEIVRARENSVAWLVG